MSDMFEQFNEDYNPEELIAAEKEAEDKGGDFAEVPYGDYEVKIKQAELKATKSTNKPMVSIWFQILKGDFKKSMLFYNQVISTGFGLKNAKDFLRSLDTEIEIEFKDFKQFNDLLLDVAENAEELGLTYHLKYEKSKKDFPIYTIEEVFESE